MQWREGGGRFKLPEDRIINQAVLPELRSAMHDSMPDGGRCRHFAVRKKFSDAEIASRWLGMAAVSESNAFPCESSRVELSFLSPIDSASPESSLSIREGPTRYNPNLSDEEPLFSASTGGRVQRLSCGNPDANMALMGPTPVPNFGHVLAVLADLELVALHGCPVTRRRPSPLDRGAPGSTSNPWLHCCLSSVLFQLRKRWFPSRRCALARLSRRGRLALLCWLSLPFRLCLLGLLIQIRRILSSVIVPPVTSTQLIVTGSGSAGAPVARRCWRPAYECCRPAPAVDGLLRSIGLPARRPSRSHTCR